MGLPLVFEHHLLALLRHRARPLVAGLLAALLAMASAAPEAQAEHLVAAVSTRGSPHQPHGSRVLDGVAAAAARINAGGGLLGEPIRVVGWDEDCTRERARQVADELVRLKPLLIVGHICAGAAMAAVPLYAGDGPVVIIPGVRQPGLRGKAAAPRVFRLAGRDDRLAADMVSLIEVKFPGKAAAIVADRTRQASQIAKAVEAELGHRKIRVAVKVALESGEKSYAGVAERIAASGAGLVIMPAQPMELGVLVADLARAGSPLPVIGSEILAVPGIEAVARQLGDGLLVMLPWTGAPWTGTGERSQQPEPAAASIHAIDPTGHAGGAIQARAEAALEAWVGAVRRAAGTAPGAVAEAMRAETTATGVGPIRFDAAGDAVVPSYVAHTWAKGRWVPLKP